MGGRSSVGEIPLILLLLQLVIPRSPPAPLTPGRPSRRRRRPAAPGPRAGRGLTGPSERGRGRPSPPGRGGRGARSGTLSVWSSPAVHAVPNTSRHPLSALFILLSGAVRISFSLSRSLSFFLPPLPPLTTLAMVGSCKVALAGEGFDVDTGAPGERDLLSTLSCGLHPGRRPHADCGV